LQAAGAPGEQDGVVCEFMRRHRVMLGPCDYYTFCKVSGTLVEHSMQR
jgi:hypothetical protein